MGIAEKRNLGEDNVFQWKLALPWLLILSCYLNTTPVDICEKKNSKWTEFIIKLF